MKSQIRGLDQGTRNAQDGVSLIQTAEGALNEVSSMLVRLKELSVQATNSTYSTDDKANIGSEMSALGAAIGDIYTKTKFNGISVFGTQTVAAGVIASNDGSANTATIAYGEDGKQTIAIKDAKTSSLNALTTATAAAATTPGGVTVDLVEAAITPGEYDESRLRRSAEPTGPTLQTTWQLQKKTSRAARIPCSRRRHGVRDDGIHQEQHPC